MELSALHQVTDGLEKARDAALGDAWERGKASPHWPTSVRACHENRWLLALTPRAGGPVRVCLYRCRSRRHPGPCRDAWRQGLYARMLAGRLGAAPLESVSFWTFTLESSYHRRISVSLLQEAHRKLASEWSRWADAVNMTLSRAGEPAMEYIWVREEHTSRVPHQHAIIVSRRLAKDCAVRTGEHFHPAPDWASSLAQRRGVIGLVDATRGSDKEKLLAYAAKVTSRAAGELAKEAQTPSGMAFRQRTFGASAGFLAPPPVSEDYAGELLRASTLSRVDGKVRAVEPTGASYWLELDLT